MAQRMRAILRAATAISLLAITQFVIGISQAGSAWAQSCLGPKGHYFAGHAITHLDGNGLTYEGTQAFIENNPAASCDSGSADNNVTAWVMIDNNADNGWAQVGYFHDDHVGLGCTYWWAQYVRGPGYPVENTVDFVDGCRLGAGVRFYVEYSSQYEDEQMRIGGVGVISRTPWDPFQVWNWTSDNPWKPQMSAESYFVGDNIPGTPSNHTQMSDIQLQRFNDTWTGTTLLGASIHTCPQAQRYGVTDLSGRAFEFWTENSQSDNVYTTCD